MVLVLAQGPALLEVAVRFVLARQQNRIGGLGPVEGGRAFHCISSVRPIPILPLAIAQSAGILAARALGRGFTERTTRQTLQNIAHRPAQLSVPTNATWLAALGGLNATGRSPRERPVSTRSSTVAARRC